MCLFHLVLGQIHALYLLKYIKHFLCLSNWFILFGFFISRHLWRHIVHYRLIQLMLIRRKKQICSIDFVLLLRKMMAYLLWRGRLITSIESSIIKAALILRIWIIFIKSVLYQKIIVCKDIIIFHYLLHLSMSCCWCPSPCNKLLWNIWQSIWLSVCTCYHLFLH